MVSCVFLTQIYVNLESVWCEFVGLSLSGDLERL